MDERTNVRAVIRGLLDKKGDTRAFGDGDSLIISGRLESIDALEIAFFLEERYGVDFAQIGFDQNQLDSVDEIVSLIGATKAGAEPAPPIPSPAP
jgi:acyl carrier protein